jgi:hypothetical protein
VPTNAVRASSHRLGQPASLAVYQRADQFDGIWYPSRLNGDENLAVFDRSVPKFSAGPRRKLVACSELALILGTYRVALVYPAGTCMGLLVSSVFRCPQLGLLSFILFKFLCSVGEPFLCPACQ